MSSFGLLQSIFTFIVSRDCVVPDCGIFGHVNDVELSKRIITSAPNFVHAVIRIGT